VVVLSEKRCLNCGYSLPSSAKFCTNCGSCALETVFPYYPPPPPPPIPQKPAFGVSRRSSKKKLTIGIATLLIVVTLVVAAVFILPGLNLFSSWQNGGSSTFVPYQQPEEPPGDVIISGGTALKATEQTIGPEGGTIRITDASSPIYGLKIEFPEGSARENVNVAVSYTDVNEISGLPENFSVASKLIKIETSGSAEWNETKHFDVPVLVTLPYDSSVDPSENPVRFYCYDRENQILDSAGYIYDNPAEHTVSFYTSCFSEFIGIGWKERIKYWLSGGPSDVDTEFRPKQNGWFIPNSGSYLTGAGNCMGMVAYAKWFYRYITVSNWQEIEGTSGWNLVGPSLHDKYREGDLDQWRDDETAIQLATRAQIATIEATDRVGKNREFYQANASNPDLSASTNVALTWVHGMKVTHEPQLIILSTQMNDGTVYVWGHAVMTYRYAHGRFDVYDPNFPDTAMGTDERQIPYSYKTGFARSYSSGFTAQSSKTQYNVFFALGWKLFANKEFYQNLYASAENKFSDDSIFPEVTFTSSITTPSGTTPIDTDGDGIRDTSSKRVTISGTILFVSGTSGSVGDGWLFVSGKKELARLSGMYQNRISFSVEVDLYSGDNEVIFLGSPDLFSLWVGFKRDVIKCTARKELMTISLTWNPEADLDLHVLEPTIGGVEGRHIWWDNPATYPADMPYDYLYSEHFQHFYPYYGSAGDTDLNSTQCYFVEENMTLPNYPGPGKSLSGTYSIRVMYIIDDDWDDITQPITYNLTARILASIDKNTGQEIWIEKSTGGVLTVSNWDYSYDEDIGIAWKWLGDDFSNRDSLESWSPIWTIDFTDPEVNTLEIPPPPQNKLPQ
jgi:hypothetical protein